MTSKVATQGQSFAEYVSTMPTNREPLTEIYNDLKFTEHELAQLNSIAKPVQLYAIVEDWCPDVVVSLPIVARASEANPLISLRVLFRPEHRTIADAYPGPDTGRSHVPTYIATDANGVDLDVLIERPDTIHPIVDQFKKERDAEIEAEFPGVARSELPSDYRAQMGRNAIAFRRLQHDLERSDIVKWLVHAAR
jgi:hypothetical protein